MSCRFTVAAAVASFLASSSTCSVAAFNCVPNNSLVRPSTRINQRHDFYTVRRQRRRSHANSSKSTELAALQLAAIGANVAKFYQSWPFVAAFITASTRAAIADSIAQYLDVCTTEFDAKRNLAMTLYSGVVLGLCLEMMFNHLFPILFRGETNPLVLAIKMTLFDGFINAPLIWLPPAYIVQALAYRYPKREALQKYISDVRENGLLKKYWSLWLPMSMINFFLVPAHFRVAFVAALGFFWMIILSLVANSNEEQDIENCPQEPEPSLDYPRAME